MTEDPRRVPCSGQGRDQRSYLAELRGTVTKQELEVALGLLRHFDRQIFLAACIDRMPDSEIARRTGLTVAQVEKRMARSVVELDRVVRGVRPSWWQKMRRLRWWPF